MPLRSISERKAYIVSEIKLSNRFYHGTKEELLEKIKNQLSDFRYKHILGVGQTCHELAKLNGVDPEQAMIAGFVHDYAKEKTDEQFIEKIKEKKLDPDLLNWGNFIWHGVVGAEFIKDELKITDEEILNAVRRHTVGAPEMTTLDQIVYVSDYVEPNRSFPDVEIARSLAYANLKQAVIFETKHTLQFLMSSSSKIYPDAILTYNAFVAEN